MSNFYNQASWVLIPSGIEEDIVFAQKPISGLGDLTFTRASDATYTDSTGVVRRSPYNLLQFSEMYTDAYWTKTATVTANTDVAPNGTLTADTLTDSNSAAFLDVRSSLITIVANRTHTTTCFIKKTTGALTHYAGIAVLLSGGTTRVDYGIVNTTTGTVVRDASSNVNSASYSIQDSGNYWRVICTFTDNQSNTSCRVILYPAMSANGTSISDTATGSNVFWGAQLVEGSSALDYFPTTNRQDVPRIDFRNADGTLSFCGRLLLEPQRTNSMIHSENVASALTSQANTTVTANTGVSPDGNTTADTILFALSSYRLRNFTIAANTSYSASLFFKNINFAGTETINLNVSDGVYGPINATIQPANGTATFTRNTLGWSSVSGVVQNYGNGWYRVAVSGTSIGGGNGWYEISSQVSKSALFWGLQFEQSAAYPTSYIPTTTAAVTRLADTASKTGISSLIGQTEGTLFAEVNWGVKPEAGSPIVSILTLNNNVTNLQNAIILGIERASAGTNRIYCLVQVSNVTQAALFGSTITSGNYKIALSYKQNDFVLYVNGVQIATDSSGNVPTTSQILLGQKFNGESFVMSDEIAQAALFPTRLTNAQLAQLTTL